MLRLRAGALVRVFDGAGAEFEATLESVTRKGVFLKLAGPVPARAESPLRIVLALSPLKGDRMELVIQKATELGVAEVRPVICARTDAAARPALQGSRQDRWDKVAAGAAEQCGRAVVPHVAPTVPLKDLLAQPFDGPPPALHAKRRERPRSHAKGRGRQRSSPSSVPLAAGSRTSPSDCARPASRPPLSARASSVPKPPPSPPSPRCRSSGATSA